MRENFRNEESDSWKNKNYSADEDAGSERERRTGMNQWDEHYQRCGEFMEERQFVKLN